MSDLADLQVTPTYAARIARAVTRTENMRGNNLRITEDSIEIVDDASIDGGTGSDGSGDSIDVWVTQTGGSAGNQTTQCSFTYSIYPWSDSGKTGTPIATSVAMQGNGQRIANATMTAGTIGRARQVGETWKLLWVDEKFQQTNCT